MASKIQNAVSKKEASGVGAPKTLRAYLKSMEGEIAKALPSVMTPERFTRIVLSAISTTPKLAKCTPESFLGAVMTAAQLGVEPNTPLGHAYLIPFNNNRKGCIECQFQLGYKGMIDLAYRSGEISIIQAHTVYENDTFEYELGLEPKLRHIPAMSNRGRAICFYAMFKTKDGGNGFEVMSRDDVENHARTYSKSFGNSPWQTNFDAMAKKTVLKQCLKYAPLKSDFVRGIVADETIRVVDKTIGSFEDANLIHAEYDIVDNAESTFDNADEDAAGERITGDFMTDEEKAEIIAAEAAEAEAERAKEEAEMGL